MSDIIDVIDDRIQNNKPASFQGKVVSKSGRIVRVRPRGSSNAVPCSYKTENAPQIGDECQVEWIVGRTKGYVVTAIYSSRATGNNYSTSQEVLTPPLNFGVSTIIPNALLLKWDAVIPSALAYEVQYNSTESESGATTDIITRGSYALIETATLKYARVRSVGRNYERSSWTDWVSALPEEGSTGSGITGVTDNIFAWMKLR